MISDKFATGSLTGTGSISRLSRPSCTIPGSSLTFLVGMNAGVAMGGNL